MTINPEHLDQLRKLAVEQDNQVAALVHVLCTANFPETPDGWLSAIKTAAEAVSDLAYEARRTVPKLRLPPDAFGTNSQNYDYSNYSNLLNQAGVVGQVWPGQILGMQNRPGPLASMLVLGMLGAGAGRIGAAGIERLGGGHNPTLNRNMTIAGALAGIVPGAVSSAVNMSAGKSPLFGDVMAVPMRKLSMSVLGRFERPMAIPVERMHDMVWRDPFVASQLPPTIAAAASAVMEGASRIGNRQNGLPFVTPYDIGRMAVGLGAGYMSGVVAGKALGAIFGVSDRSQDILRRSGATAGLIQAVIPSIFGAQ